MQQFSEIMQAQFNGRIYKYIKIKSFIILVTLCRSVSRVGEVHLRVIAPVGRTAPFEEILLRGVEPLATLCLI